MKILMTGITGLVGASFTTALLRNNPSYRIVSLCRGFCGTSGRDRADQVIRDQCEMDGTTDADEIISRVEIIEGTLENLPGDELAAKGPYDAFFHCAASVNLGKDPEGKTYKTNFGGTEAALALAKRAKVPVFHYVSTAYVAGLCHGRIMEDSMPATEWNNSYERSKYNAEKMVRESGFPYTVYRPAIVVGRRSDGVIRKPLAFFRLLEFLGKLKHSACGRLGIPVNGPLEKDLRIKAGTTDKIYFVPQDYVQEAISKLYNEPICNRTYHITGDSPVSTLMIRDAVSEVLQIRGLRVVDTLDNPSREELLVDKMLEDLFPYFASDIVFDQTNVRKALGDKILDWKLDVPFLTKMVRAYYRKNDPELVK